MSLVTRGFALSLVLAPSLLAAQTPPPQNNVLQIYREVVKAGKGPAHDAMETAWSWAMIQAKSPNNITCPAPPG